MCPQSPRLQRSQTVFNGLDSNLKSVEDDEESSENGNAVQNISYPTKFEVAIGL